MTEMFGMVSLGEIIKHKLNVLVGNPKQYFTALLFEDTVKETKFKEEETYDLEIDSEYHNYYANNICVSNSHSLAYSYLAMQTLYLKYYYPTEFYTSLLNHIKASNDKEEERRWLTSAIVSALSVGIKIVPPTRKSNWKWTMIDENTISMGFSGINGMGEVACNELTSKNIGELNKEEFFQTDFSGKFNKAHIEACIKAGVFDDWFDSRDEMRNLWQNRKKKKSVTKKNMKLNIKQATIFGDVVDSLQDVELSVEATEENVNEFSPTTTEEKDKDAKEVLGIDFSILKNISTIKKMFNDEYGIDIQAFSNFENEDSYYYFRLDGVIEKESKKGTTYYQILISDGSFEKRMPMFADEYKNVKSDLEVGRFYVTKFVKDNGWLNFKKKTEFRMVL